MTTTVIAKPANAAFNEKPLGGTLIWGTHTKPTIINPILTTCSVSTSLLDLVFNRLVRWNAKGEIEPDLAESWEISEDGLVYTFYLRRGVKFHDGRECTALDVKFTYDMIIDPKVDSPFKESFELIRTFRAVNKYTFQIILKKPFVPIMCRLTKEIMPKHLLDKTDIRISAFNFNPIGTGPFKFREWTKDNTIILEYNPDYYEGRPNLERIIIKTYSDSRALWTALMRREVDFVLFIEKEDYEVVKVEDTFSSYNLPVDYYYALCYDLNDPVLEDIRVRQAIAHSINTKSLINTVAGGYGMECTGPFYP
ncbi:MAG: ABC transporter substrate-binding protein, partial [Candidatus Pacebacteria bacterium]|nr:ABC transporter substrate-binding protein [Candidatus Paceibacterota bacterium]